MTADKPFNENDPCNSSVIQPKVRLNRKIWMNLIFITVVLCGLVFASGYVIARVRHHNPAPESSRGESQMPVNKAKKETQVYFLVES